METPGPDTYGGMGYRSLFGWSDRLRREGPLLLRVLAEAPSRRVLDLGCGSGEHSRFLRAQGFAPTGVDRSPAQLAQAREADPEGSYREADLTGLSLLDLAPQGGALCLGNTLPHLTEEAQVRAFLTGLRAALAPGAPFVLQVLNYDRILDRQERTFPVQVRPGEAEGEETVFLRLMTHHGDGRLTFTPARLRFRPDGDRPLEVLAAHAVPLRGWRRAQLEAFLGEAGFSTTEVLGSLAGAPWTPDGPDLVVVARRAS